MTKSDIDRNEETTIEQDIERDLQKTVNSLTTSFEHLGMEDKVFEKFAQAIEKASTVNEIVRVISKLALKLEQKITSKDCPSKIDSESLGQSNYDELEKLLQKYEAEIRDHIRIEQQLKIYSESLEERVAELETKLQMRNDSKVEQKIALGVEDSNRERISKTDKILKLKNRENVNHTKTTSSEAVN